MEFKLPIYLPVSKQTVSCRELYNSDYFPILKYLTTNNMAQIGAAFEELILELSNKEVVYAFDKFVLLSTLRSIIIGDTIEIYNANKETLKYSISKIITDLSGVISTFTHDTKIFLDDLTLELSLPTTLYFNNTEDVIKSSIINIIDNKKTIKYYLYNDEQKEIFFDSLPANILLKIQEHMSNIMSSTESLELIPTNKLLNIEGIPCNLYSNILLEFLKIIYSQDLMHFYELQYNLTTKLNVSYSQFMDMTPAESKIFLNFYKKENKTAHSENNKINLPVAPTYNDI